MNHRSIRGVLIDSKSVDKFSRKANNIYFQCLNAYINLRIFTLMKCKKKENINEVLKVVGLNFFKKTKIYKYSPEMKKKMNIATELLLDKTPIELLEPTGGLDIQGKIEIKNLINEISFQKNKEFTIYSRDMDELKFICTNIVENN